MKEKSRFAVQILFYDCDQFILQTIENCSPFVEKIYVAHSSAPWSYNRDSRENYKNPSDPKLLSASRHYEKIELVEGVWDTEEDQRNACVERARLDGFDFMIIQDADEFYLPEDYLKNINDILSNPNYSYYVTSWINFWKNVQYVFEFRDPGFGVKDTIYARCPNFAINLRRDVSFESKRIINKKDYKVLSGLCYHFSYVMTDEQALRKINTWGHANQVSRYWYRLKWKAWTPTKRYLFPLNFVTVNRAVEWHGPLPKEAREIEIVGQQYLRLGLMEEILCFFLDISSLFVFYKNGLKSFAYKMRHKILRDS